MAKVKPSKSGNKPPITRHPLFPATVALWFGALFGIGSLAIRPSLFEGIVVSLGIDAIAPIMAPPLGVTTRILLALAMAAFGGTLGSRLARRIARPKPVKVQRKRGAAATAGAGLSARGSRRAAFASDNVVDIRDDYDDRAQVPGSAKILDVSQFDLDGFETDIEAPAKLNTSAHDAETAPLAGAGSWQPAEEFDRVPEGAQVFQPTTEDRLAEQHPENLADSDSETDRQTFQDFSAPAVYQVTVGEHDADVASTVDEQQIDEHTAIKAEAEEPAPFAAPTAERAPFAAPTDVSTQDYEPPIDEPEVGPLEIDEESDQQSLGRLDGESDDPYAPLPPKARPGSIFDQLPSAGLFAKPLNAQVPHVGWENGTSRDTPPAATENPPIEEEVASEQPTPEDELPVEQPAQPASERIEQAPLDDLSHVELLERLALSMRRKRAQATVAQEVIVASPEPVEIPITAEPEIEEIAEPVEAKLSPPVPTIPDALRPVGLEDDEDADLLPAFVPPRHFAQPQAVNGQNTAPSEALAAEQPESEPAKTEPVDELEEGYSSLLSLSRPGAGPQRFVRIEEPAPLSDEVEPVVVFPGKETAVGEGPFARPAATANGTADASADADGEAKADGPVKRLDSEETDRALRTALANLQRMSGAA